MKYIFQQPLMEGLILKRKNRFVMEVMIDDKIEICHCPCTGRIANIIFENIPCLLTPTDNFKTKYTVEAISLNNLNEKNKKWIGINQIKANKYVEYLLQTNQLSKIIKINKNSIISRERKIGNSKLDFLINNEIRLEVKTPLIILPLKDNYKTNKNIKYNIGGKVSTDRFFKHIGELTDSSQNQHRSIMLCFYMFDAELFVPPKSEKTNYISKKVNDALNSGVEMWQVNCKFDKNGLELIKPVQKMDFSS
jgi:sugar fermentation stimulation protein A